MTVYCDNDPCEAEAVFSFTTEDGGTFHLCLQCGEAFQHGQTYPAVGLRVLGANLGWWHDRRDAEGNLVLCADCAEEPYMEEQLSYRGTLEDPSKHLCVRCEEPGTHSVVPEWVDLATCDLGLEPASECPECGFEWPDDSVDGKYANDTGRCPACEVQLDEPAPVQDAADPARLDWLVTQYARSTGQPLDERETVYADLLTDIMHDCRRHGVEFGPCLKRAESRYREEEKGS